LTIFASASVGIEGEHVRPCTVERSATSEALRRSLSRCNCTARAIDSANYADVNECSSQFTAIAFADRAARAQALELANSSDFSTEVPAPRSRSSHSSSGTGANMEFVPQHAPDTSVTDRSTYWPVIWRQTLEQAETQQTLLANVFRWVALFAA
jgi:hypothetical protein